MQSLPETSALREETKGGSFHPNEQSIPGVGAILVVVLLAALIAFGLGVPAGLKLFAPWDASSPQARVFTDVTFLALSLCLTWGLLQRRGGSARSLLGRIPNRHQLMRGLWLSLMSLGVTVTCILLEKAVIAWTTDAGVFSKVGKGLELPQSGGSSVVTNLLTIVGGVVLAPIAEEFIFRGLLLTRLSVKWGMPRAILCTSLIFGLVHLEIAGHVFFGYVMAVLYVESRSLYVPILTHAFSNGWLALNSVLVGEARPIARVSPPVEAASFTLIVGLALALFFIPWAAWFTLRHFPQRFWRSPYFDQQNH